MRDCKGCTLIPDQGGTPVFGVPLWLKAKLGIIPLVTSLTGVTPGEKDQGPQTRFTSC